MFVELKRTDDFWHRWASPIGRRLTSEDWIKCGMPAIVKCQRGLRLGSFCDCWTQYGCVGGSTDVISVKSAEASIGVVLVLFSVYLLGLMHREIARYVRRRDSGMLLWGFAGADRRIATEARTCRCIRRSEVVGMASRNRGRKSGSAATDPVDPRRRWFKPDVRTAAAGDHPRLQARLERDFGLPRYVQQSGLHR